MKKLLLLAVLLVGCGEDNGQPADYTGNAPPAVGNFIELNREGIEELRQSCIAQTKWSTVEENVSDFELEVLNAKYNYESCAALWIGIFPASCNADAMYQLARSVVSVCD